MRIGFGLDVARLNVDEIVTGQWSFTNLDGLAVDVIAEVVPGSGLTLSGIGGLITSLLREFTPDAGVTIDGVRLRDRAFDVVDYPFGTTTAMWFAVVGDAEYRYRVRADGLMEWGDGAGARDTNFYRAGPGLLKTDDSLEVGGAVDVIGNVKAGAQLLFNTIDIGLPFGLNHNVATGSVVVVTSDAVAGSGVTGFAGGVAGRSFCLIIIGANATTLSHQHAGSIAANRLVLPGAVDLVINSGGAVWFWYDGFSSRWRVMSSGQNTG